MWYVSINPELLHLIGSFSLQLYGFFMAFGILSIIIVTLFDRQRRDIMPINIYESCITVVTISALCGARLLHLASEWHRYTTVYDALALWNGGLSILGAVIAGSIAAPLFLWINRLPILPVLDIAARALPLGQAVARIGCLLVGCCFGQPTFHAWAVVYTHAGSHAPLGIALHPTQLYSSLIFLGMFLLFQTLSRTSILQIGQLAALYLIGSGAERFVIDFFRGDRIINSSDALIMTTWLSFHQVISIMLMIVGLLWFFIPFFTNHKHIW